MINIHDKAHELANSIKQLDEVKKLREISEKIESDDNLKSLVFNEQRAKGCLDKNTEEKFKEVSKRVMENSVVSEYVQYEQRIGIIVDDLMKILNDAFGIQSFV